MMVTFFLLGALALLVAVLLFGFVGCGLYLIGTGPSPDYPTAVLTTGNLVAYWHLGEPASTPVPSSGGAAQSQVGGYNGDYEKLSPVSTPNAAWYSDRTPGKIFLGKTPGLLQLSSASPCIQVDGGYVQVPFDDHLNPAQFTFEAWVWLPIITGEYYRCLVESTGPQGLGQKLTGWGLYLGPKDLPPNPSNLIDPYWQVWMGDGTQFSRVAVAKDPANVNQLTYLALTFNGKRLSLFLYYPDTQQQLDIPTLLALNANVTTFKRNDTSMAGGGDFFIGTGSNLFPGAGSSPHRLYPFKGKIQEVALYNKDLSGGPPDFPGVFSTLSSHEMSGGNL